MRFQATTNVLLDEELEALRKEMGLRENQKAELLRELTSMAAWLVGHVRAGRVVEARGPDGVDVFRHPALEGRGGMRRVRLDPDEADALATLLAADEPLSGAARETLRRVAGGQPPPKLRWPER